MNTSAPHVSVIIPTRDKPDLLMRSVRSALSQTLENVEVLVIVDGPDDVTLEVMRTFRDSRLRIVQLDHNVGPAAARNAGVNEARSPWVAFLDHDDEWLPEKLEAQWQVARQSTHVYPIIGCRLIVRYPQRDLVWPKRFPKPYEPMSEYLFCRTQLFGGEGILQTSTILTAKALLQAVPFRTEAKNHDDLDWVLRATMRPDAGVHYVSNSVPLAIWHRDDNRSTISSNPNWRFSLEWSTRNKTLFTRRAYAAYLLTWVSANAVHNGDRRECLRLIRRAFREGTPSVLDVGIFWGIWLMPHRWRIQNVLLFSGRRLDNPIQHPPKMSFPYDYH